MYLKSSAKSVEICDFTQGTKLELEGDLPYTFRAYFVVSSSRIFLTSVMVTVRCVASL